MKLTPEYLLTPIPANFDDLDKDLADKMMAFMRRRKGLGLAANQVGYKNRLFVMDVKYPRRCFNPEILWAGNIINTEFEEGCLSYPNQFILKPRSMFIIVRYMNQNGKMVEAELYDKEAICFQHELDHLNGIPWNSSGQYY